MISHFFAGYDCWTCVLFSGRCIPTDDWPSTPEDSILHQGSIFWWQCCCGTGTQCWGWCGCEVWRYGSRSPGPMMTWGCDRCEAAICLSAQVARLYKLMFLCIYTGLMRVIVHNKRLVVYEAAEFLTPWQRRPKLLWLPDRPPQYLMFLELVLAMANIWPVKLVPFHSISVV